MIPARFNLTNPAHANTERPAPVDGVQALDGEIEHVVTDQHTKRLW